MDHELIAHLDRLSKLEVSASAQKKQDVVDDLRALETYLLYEGKFIGVDVINDAIEEITLLRKELR